MLLNSDASIIFSVKINSLSLISGSKPFLNFSIETLLLFSKVKKAIPLSYSLIILLTKKSTESSRRLF